MFHQAEESIQCNEQLVRAPQANTSEPYFIWCISEILCHPKTVSSWSHGIGQRCRIWVQTDIGPYLLEWYTFPKYPALPDLEESMSVSISTLSCFQSGIMGRSSFRIPPAITNFIPQSHSAWLQAESGQSETKLHQEFPGKATASHCLCHPETVRSWSNGFERRCVAWIRTDMGHIFSNARHS
jgi:hypothetical protein